MVCYRFIHLLMIMIFNVATVVSSRCDYRNGLRCFTATDFEERTPMFVVFIFAIHEPLTFNLVYLKQHSDHQIHQISIMRSLQHLHI